VNVVSNNSDDDEEEAVARQSRELRAVRDQRRMLNGIRG